MNICSGLVLVIFQLKLKNVMVKFEILFFEVVIKKVACISSCFLLVFNNNVYSIFCTCNTRPFVAPATIVCFQHGEEKSNSYYVANEENVLGILKCHLKDLWIQLSASAPVRISNRRGRIKQKCSLSRFDCI